LASFTIHADTVAYDKWDEVKTCISLWKDGEKSKARHRIKRLEDYQVLEKFIPEWTKV